MGFSRSRSNHHVNPNYGSNHYQRRGGFLGGLFNMLGSRSSASGHNNQYPQQYPNQSMHSQNSGMIVCSRCKNFVPTGSKFCLECGEKVNAALFCMNCGEQLPANAKFCLKCGAKQNG